MMGDRPPDITETYFNKMQYAKKQNVLNQSIGIPDEFYSSHWAGTIF